MEKEFKNLIDSILNIEQLTYSEFNAACMIQFNNVIESFISLVCETEYNLVLKLICYIILIQDNYLINIVLIIIRKIIESANKSETSH